MMISIENADAFVFTGGRDLDAGKPTVMFVHGAGLDHSVWTLPTRYFIRHGLNVLSVDLPGHGRSAGPLRTSIPDMSDWLIKVLDALDVQEVALVGHSMGSLVTLEAAARHPTRIRSIALLGTALPMPVTDELLAAAGPVCGWWAQRCVCSKNPDRVLFITISKPVTNTPTALIQQPA